MVKVKFCLKTKGTLAKDHMHAWPNLIASHEDDCVLFGWLWISLSCFGSSMELGWPDRSSWDQCCQFSLRPCFKFRLASVVEHLSHFSLLLLPFDNDFRKYEH